MDDDIIKDAREAFEQAQEAEKKNRERARDDLRFSRLGEQWPEDVKRDREIEQRPCLTINRMPSFIRQVVNDSRQNKPGIRTHPVDSNADPETAEIINGLIRSIEVTSNADVAYDTAIDFAASAGFGYFRVDLDYAYDDSFDLDIAINRITNPFSVYGDPRSEAADSSDWNVAYVTDMLKKSEFETEYKGADQINWESLYADIKDEQWLDDDSVRVAEYWTREDVETELYLLSDGNVMHQEDYVRDAEWHVAQGVTPVKTRPCKTKQVTQHILTGAEVLETNEWAGKYIPIVPVYGEEVVIDGERHFLSMVHFAKDAQRMYNYWRTMATELVALAPKAPWVGPAGSFDTDPNWALANVKNTATLEYDVVAGAPPPQRQEFAGIPAGALQEALNASDDMKSIFGMYDASLGARSNETSGKAIISRQREGDVATFHLIDNLSRAIRHTGRIVVDLIPHVYSEQRIIRVLGEDHTPDAKPINQPVPVMGEDGSPQMDDEGNAITRIYSLTTGKYDVTVSSGPSFTTRREEAANQMIELLRAFPQAAPAIGDLLAKNLDWPGADEIAERLKALLPDELKSGGDPRLKQAMQTIDGLKQAIDQLMRDRSLEERKIAIDQLKANVDVRKAVTDAYEAETDRMAKQAKAAQPVTTPQPESIL